MDWNLVLSAVLGAAGGVGTAFAALWRLSQKLTLLDSGQKQLTRDLEKAAKDTEHELSRQSKECRDQFEKLERDFDTHVREQNQRWNVLNRTLGQIEGEVLRTRRPPAV